MKIFTILKNFYFTLNLIKLSSIEQIKVGGIQIRKKSDLSKVIKSKVKKDKKDKKILSKRKKRILIKKKLSKIISTTSTQKEVLDNKLDNNSMHFPTFSIQHSNKEPIFKSSDSTIKINKPFTGFGDLFKEWETKIKPTIENPTNPQPKVEESKSILKKQDKEEGEKEFLLTSKIEEEFKFYNKEENIKTFEEVSLIYRMDEVQYQYPIFEKKEWFEDYKKYSFLYRVYRTKFPNLLTLTEYSYKWITNFIYFKYFPSEYNSTDPKVYKNLPSFYISQLDVEGNLNVIQSNLDNNYYGFKPVTSYNAHMTEMFNRKKRGKDFIKIKKLERKVKDFSELEKSFPKSTKNPSNRPDAFNYKTYLKYYTIKQLNKILRFYYGHHLKNPQPLPISTSALQAEEFKNPTLISTPTQPVGLGRVNTSSKKEFKKKEEEKHGGFNKTDDKNFDSKVSDFLKTLIPNYTTNPNPKDTPHSTKIPHTPKRRENKEEGLENPTIGESSYGGNIKFNEFDYYNTERAEKIEKQTENRIKYMQNLMIIPMKSQQKMKIFDLENINIFKEGEKILKEYKKASKKKKLWYDYLLKKELWSENIKENIIILNKDKFQIFDQELYNISTNIYTPTPYSFYPESRPKVEMFKNRKKEGISESLPNKYLNPFNTVYNYFRYLYFKDIILTPTNDGDQLLKLQKLLLTNYKINPKYSNKINNRNEYFSKIWQIESGLNFTKFKEEYEGELRKLGEEMKINRSVYLDYLNEKNKLMSTIDPIYESKFKNIDKKIIILLFTNKKIKINLNIFNEFQKEFFSLCSIYDLKIVYTGKIPNYKNYTTTSSNSVTSNSRPKTKDSKGTKSKDSKIPHTTSSVELSESEYYYFPEGHYFYAIEIPYKVHQNELNYLKVLWILTEIEKKYKIIYYTQLQTFSSNFYYNGIDLSFHCYPSKEYALQAFEMVFLQFFKDSFENIENFQNVIKELDKKQKFYNYPSLVEEYLEYKKITSNIFNKKLYTYPNYVNIIHRFPPLEDTFYIKWVNTIAQHLHLEKEKKFRLVFIFDSFDFVSNPFPEILFRFLINYWQFDFKTNKFFPMPEYFNLSEFSLFKLDDRVLNSFLGRKYFIHKTISPENHLNYKQFIELEFKKLSKS